MQVIIEIMKEFLGKLGGYILWGYNHTHWFTDKEAWFIFRLGAFMEATGWTLLISAIIYIVCAVFTWFNVKVINSPYLINYNRTKNCLKCSN